MATTDTDTKPWIRGVNIGGWLLLERFITPYTFALTTCHLKGDFRWYPGQIDAPPTSSPLYKPMDAQALKECKPVATYPVDEWTLTDAFGDDKDLARKYLEFHYDNFVTREDIVMLKENGATHVRVPLGHWITGNIADDEPYVDGGWKYFARLVGWCREVGIEVWPDIHTAPGSQNGFDNSGHLLDVDPTCHGWDMDDKHASDYNSTILAASMGLDSDSIPSDGIVLSNNAQRSLTILDEVTSAIARDGLTDVVTGFGNLNEPFANCDIDVIKKFDDLSKAIVRRNMGGDASLYIGDVFNKTKFNDGFWTDEKDKGTYLDSHYYHVFDERPRHLGPREHIALVCQKNHRDAVGCCYEDEEEMTIPSKGISRIIGEWSASFDTLVGSKLDDVMKNIARNGVALEFDRIIPPERKAFLRNFVEAQMVSYEAKEEGVSTGWFYWTLKMEGGAFAEWDFSRGLREDWMPKIPPKNTASESIFGSCYDIIFKTFDDESIIHEYPDPNSLDPNNWQGFAIDDDVVLSHGNSLKKDDAGNWYDAGPPVPFTKTFPGKETVMIVILCVIYIVIRKKPRRGYTAVNDSDRNKTIELSI